MCSRRTYYVIAGRNIARKGKAQSALRISHGRGCLDRNPQTPAFHRIHDSLLTLLHSFSLLFPISYNWNSWARIAWIFIPMASISSSSSAASSSSTGQPIDPIARTALRYSLSAREYKLLHKYLIARSRSARKRVPEPKRYERAVTGPDDYNAAAIRSSLRVFAATFAGLKVWDLFTEKILTRGKAVQYVNCWRYYQQLLISFAERE